ncbi:MAG: hypothetical protein ACI9KN_002189 [Gammaproteobacteria bacterium]|jgi:hypothetical protein
MSALPENFGRVSRDTSAIQQFLRKQLPDPMNQQVTVVNLTDEEIIIAVADPQITNYLRLYSTEIQQQIQETFNLKQVLKVRTMPNSMLKPSSTSTSVMKPSRVKPETAQALQRGADWIEDEKLKEALKSLASCLNKT